MSLTRQIYLLDPKHLSPETIAVAFAKTSRSPKTFNEIASELSDEKSADFNEKWVVGYGHSSVAEHAVLHIAVENISRLAVECLESNRLASYTEKSSRYQIWGMEHFYTPQEFANSAHESLYAQTCERLFTSYQNAVAKIQDYLQTAAPRRKNESAGAFKSRIRTQCADVCRYYLPACSLANVGMTINARSLEHAICKMLSHPLEEVQRIGDEIKKVSQQNIPTLVKYADRNDCMLQARQDFSNYPNTGVKLQNQDWLQIVHADEDGEMRVLAALLAHYGEMPYQEAQNKIIHSSKQENMDLANRFLGKSGKHDSPPRELEYANITIDMVLDQGAYFELKRHRMMTQTAQRFTARLGYAIPKLIVDAGLLDEYTADMDELTKVYENFYISNPEAAAYILPNAFNRRVLMQTNLRSALHFVKLRSAPNAHFAIRRAAQRLSIEIQRYFPLFAKFFTVNSRESWKTISENYFSKTV